MNDDDATTVDAGRPVVPPAATTIPAPVSAPAPAWRGGPVLIVIALVAALLAIAALAIAWRAEQRVRGSERELVQRQTESAERVAEALLLARQAQDGQREAVAKVALLEQRLNEASTQREQLDELVQQLTRSRDQNLVADLDALVRAAAQQAALTGSVEPLVATLRQADERLARANEPRLEPVRRAIARDLDRARTASVADAATLSIRLDESIRLVDELPLLASAESARLRRGQAHDEMGAVDRANDRGSDRANDRADDRAAARAAERAELAEAAARPASSATEGIGGWLSRHVGGAAKALFDGIWVDVRSLVRVTRIDRPEAMLASPEQAYYLRENLKLRLLNARLSVLARSPEGAHADLKEAIASIDRYFDRTSKRTQTLLETLQQVQVLARQSGVPRPDDTLAALQTAGALR